MLWERWACSVLNKIGTKKEPWTLQESRFQNGYEQISNLCGFAEAAHSTTFSSRPKTRASRPRFMFKVYGENGRGALARCVVDTVDCRRRWSAAVPFSSELILWEDIVIALERAGPLIYLLRRNFENVLQPQHYTSWVSKIQEFWTFQKLLKTLPTT